MTSGESEAITEGTALSEGETAAASTTGTGRGADGDGGILVAYFSNTGNTEAVAGQIAELTGGTLAEIQRAQEYGDLQSEAEEEILEGIRPEITSQCHECGRL